MDLFGPEFWTSLGPVGSQTGPKWSPKRPRRPPDEDRKFEITATSIIATNVDLRRCIRDAGDPMSRRHPGLVRIPARTPRGNIFLMEVVGSSVDLATA